MSVRIRLRRVGRKKQPSYRLVVADSRTPRDGAYIDTVGFYNPRTKPAQLTLDIEKVDAWLAQGASASDTVASLIRKARRGGDAKVALLRPEDLSRRAERAPETDPAAATPKRGKSKASAPGAVAPEAATGAAAAPEAAAAEAAAPEAATPEAATPEAASSEASETTPVGDEPGGVEPEDPDTPRGEVGEAAGEGSENKQA